MVVNKNGTYLCLLFSIVGVCLTTTVLLCEQLRPKDVFGAMLKGPQTVTNSSWGNYCLSAD